MTAAFQNWVATASRRQMVAMVSFCGYDTRKMTDDELRALILEARRGGK